MTFKRGKMSVNAPQGHTGEVVVQPPSFLNLEPDGNEWLLYPKKNPLNSWLGGPQSHSWHFRDQKIFLPLLGFEPWTIQTAA
jgi:hypothetical protein